MPKLLKYVLNTKTRFNSSSNKFSTYIFNKKTYYVLKNLLKVYLR